MSIQVLVSCKLKLDADSVYSPVFRDMVKLGSTSTKKPLELDDKELECAETISDVLDILSTSNDIISLPVAESISVFRFMKKYAMDRELDRIGLQLQAGIVNRKNAFMIWLLATEAEMFEVAGRAIENLGSFTWTGELPKERREIQGEHVSKGHVFDFTTWDLDLYRLVPREAVWALGRASRKVSTFDPKPTPAELKSMGEEYTRLMKLPKECKSCEI